MYMIRFNFVIFLDLNQPSFQLQYGLYFHISATAGYGATSQQDTKF